jgi:hypothetical protein
LTTLLFSNQLSPLYTRGRKEERKLKREEWQSTMPNRNDYPYF